MSFLPTYLALLQRGVALCDTLAKVYEPDIAQDWASRTLMQIGSLRMGLADCLIDPELVLEQTSLVTGMIDKYIDSHWADYREIPKSDLTKRARVLELHEDLMAVINGVGAISNVLREDRLSRSQT
ncbi:MAG: hypothetical protein EOO63_12360 [Hymenobacter sp.]|nr:MAG: hypothetical protein EOO63_12360 [Hymenobacter sp.]